MSLSANGRSAVFLRSPGAVRMDLDGVERLALSALGGVDAVTIETPSGRAKGHALPGGATFLH